jgi:hypothetical protein
MTVTATTTPPDVLAKLQAAWQQPAAPNADDPETVAYCGPHNDPTEWEFSADRYGRLGWRTAHCKRCGHFVGYQPPQQTKGKRKTKT